MAFASWEKRVLGFQFRGNEPRLSQPQPHTSLCFHPSSLCQLQGSFKNVNQTLILFHPEPC